MRARLYAWWEGYEYEDPVARYDFDDEESQGHNVTYVASEAPDPTPEYKPPPRIVALDLLWGEGRFRPGQDEADEQASRLLKLEPQGCLAILGPGLAAPVIAAANTHTGKIDVFEWREDMFEPLQQGVRKALLEGRVTVIPFDLKAPDLPKQHYDGMISIDDLAYSDASPELAKQMIECLKPGARVVVEAYAAETGSGEENMRSPSELVAALRTAGFSIEARSDLSQDFLNYARRGFKGLGARLKPDAGLSVSDVKELANETGEWRAKMASMAVKKLQRWRILGRRPPEAKAAPVKKEAPPPKAAPRKEVAWRAKPDNSLDVLQKVLSEEERKAERLRKKGF